MPKVFDFGTLPDDWSECALADITPPDRPIVYGIVQAGPHYPGGVPYIRSTDVGDELDLDSLPRTSPEIAAKYRRAEVWPGDLVFSLRGNIGEMSIVPSTLPVANLTQGTARIATNGAASTAFVRYALSSKAVVSGIEAVAKGSTFREISIDQLRKVRIPLPPPETQERIVTVLSHWDCGIRQLTDLIASKVRFKQGLMQQLLTGKRRFPEFDDEWKHEEIGRYLEECSSRVSATTTLPIYTSSRAGLKPQEQYYGGRKVINDGEYGVVPVDCFVFRHMSDDGLFVFHINQTGGDIAVSKEYPVFRAINLDRHFLLAKLNHSPDFKTFASTQKAGGTRTRLYFSKLRRWKTLLPSLPEQRRISKLLNAADREIDILRQELHALKQQKKGLMQLLLTGHVRLPESTREATHA